MALGDDYTKYRQPRGPRAAGQLVASARLAGWRPKLNPSRASVHIVGCVTLMNSKFHLIEYYFIFVMSRACGGRDPSGP